MKFEAVIGNPPYQEPMAKTSDPAIYNYYMDVGYEMVPIACFITPAKFLFNAGKTPKKWNQKMLNDEHLKVAFCELDGSKIFSESSFEGGVAITYHDTNISFGKIGTFLATPELRSILQRVDSLNTLSSIVYAPESYKFTQKMHADFPNAIKKLSRGHANDITTNIFKKLPEIFLDNKPQNNEKYVRILGLSSKKRVYKWVNVKYISEHGNLMKYKIFVPKSNGSPAVGSGSFTSVIGTPLLAEPFVGHTQTFISIGAFDTLFEADALLKYVKTKIVRMLLSTLKVTQDNKKEVWRNVPLQDFTEHSDIDWSKSIAEIDQQLYRKYNLSDDEIAFIEKMIKPME